MRFRIAYLMLGVIGSGHGGTDGKPNEISMHAAPERAALRGGNCGVALSREGGDFFCVVGKVLIRGVQTELAFPASLNIVVEGFKVGAWNLHVAAG